MSGLILLGAFLCVVAEAAYTIGYTRGLRWARQQMVTCAVDELNQRREYHERA
jgi:hypothetical protein